MNQIQCNKCQRKYRNLDAFWQHTETSKRCKPGKVKLKRYGPSKVEECAKVVIRLMEVEK